MLLFRCVLFLVFVVQSFGKRYKYDRVYEDMSAIQFADALKDGFRVILTDQFISTHLRPSSLATIFVSAIPIGGGPRVSRILYPDSVDSDKMVTIAGLAQRSWYYVCLEWEVVNHHNETTGTACKMYRTLDRFGKQATTAITDVEVTKVSGEMMRFKVKFDADYKARLTAYLNGESVKGTGLNRDPFGRIIPAQTFIADSPGYLDIYFPFLDPLTQYGQLCVIEEPMDPAYSAMGRLIAGLRREKCYFDGLKTKSEVDGRPMMATQPASAFKQVLNSSSGLNNSLAFALLLVLVSALI